MKFLKRKHKGSSGLGDILATAVCIIATLTIITFGINMYSLLRIKTSLDSYTREALLILETSGTMTTTQVTELVDKVKKFGFTTVTVTFNDTNTAVSYGKEVSIVISAQASYKELGLPKIYDTLTGNEKFNFQSALYSISKA